MILLFLLLMKKQFLVEKILPVPNSRPECKICPIYDQNGQNWYNIYHQNGWAGKACPLELYIHVHIPIYTVAHKTEYPTLGEGGTKLPYMYCVFGSHFIKHRKFCGPFNIRNNSKKIVIAVLFTVPIFATCISQSQAIKQHFRPVWSLIRKLCLNISGSSSVLEEDMLILRVVEAYCTSARARHTLNSKCHLQSL